MGVDKSAIRKHALRLARQDGRHLSAKLAAEFGISRQAATRHLARLVSQGELVPSGAGRGRIYRLAVQRHEFESYDREGLSEDVVWRSLVLPVVADLPVNVRDIWQYGITEMVNNAIDHSGGTLVHVGVSRNALYTSAWVVDDGEGIFLKIQRALGLYDPRESILELAKGKFTTDPARHTGEGIFFTSKMFDRFDIRSDALHFTHDGDDEPEWLIEFPPDIDETPGMPGTLVLMRLDNDSPRTTSEVFDRFAAPEEYTFAKTIVPVRLAQYEGEKLVSRSQAKRLTMRFERFKTVILDFEGVAEIGQAFADEVFRVFQAAHPDTELVPLHMTDPVRNMIERALAAGRS